MIVVIIDFCYMIILDGVGPTGETTLGGCVILIEPHSSFPHDAVQHK